MTKVKVPTYDTLMNPVIQALQILGGSGTIDEIDNKVAEVADKGLFVTTGTFTKEAIREATRDGAPAIDLINGEQLMDKLKELGLGVQTEQVQVEKVTVDHDWFMNI